jgi:hypothetical protein
MQRDRSLYDQCDDLFADCPQAVQPVNRSGTIGSMVLMLRDGANDGYFALTCDGAGDSAVYLIWSWPGGSITEIDAAGTSPVGAAAASAITLGVPVPRDGSLFGWVPPGSGTVTSLLVIYAEYTPVTPEPGWAVMPSAGAGPEQWPPFADEPLFGNWTWNYREGRLVPLADVVARSPGTVFWVDTKPVLGSDCCAVACDLAGPDGWVLPRGRYAYHQVLRAGEPVPALDRLLADPGKIDLATRFQQMLRGDTAPVTPGTR